MSDIKGLSGLQNFGNTCYINTAIQCLSNTPLLKEFFFGDDIDRYLKKKNLLTTELHKLLTGIYEENCIISPVSFFRSVKSIGRKQKYELNFSDQTDIQEFIIFIINELHEELKREVNITISGEIKNKEDQMAYDSMTGWKNYFKNNYSKIIELFYGQIVSRIKVVDKEIESLTYSPICVFSLPIPQTNDNSPISIYRCFDLLTEDTLLDGDNKWKYDKDSQYYTANQSIKIWKFPPVFIIHLKRFTNMGLKISSKIDFPVNDLNLQDYGVGYEKFHSKYELYAISNHIGNTNMGHYYAYCKNSDDGKWYNFDDDSVTEMDESDLVTNNAYCLFYKKIF